MIPFPFFPSTGPTTLTLDSVSSNNVFSGTSSIPIPVGTQVGDVAVLFNTAYAASSVDVSLTSWSAGWTASTTFLTSGSLFSVIIYKVITASDLGTSVRLTWIGSSGAIASIAANRKTLFVFRPDRDVNSLSVGSLQVSSIDVSGSITNSLTMSSAQTAVLGFYHHSTVQSFITTQSTGLTFSDITNSGGSFGSNLLGVSLTGYKVFNDGDNFTNGTMSNVTAGSGRKILQSFYLQVD